MSDDVINIEVDGKPVEAKRGQMVIEVTDQIGAYVPRLCYHEKLSVAANCRMCLVGVERAPKPLPACATPVMDGMNLVQEFRKIDGYRFVPTIMLTTESNALKKIECFDLGVSGWLNKPFKPEQLLAIINVVLL